LPNLGIRQLRIDGEGKHLLGGQFSFWEAAWLQSKVVICSLQVDW